MSKYQLITDLCESKMFRTRQAADKFSDSAKNELLYSTLLSVIALSQDTKTRAWANDYAGQTAAFSNFDFFRPSATDLYVLFHLARESGKLDSSQISKALSLLKSMGKGDLHLDTAQNLLLRLERSLSISDSRLRNARRVIANWSHDSEEGRRDALSQLVLAIQRHSRQSEALPYLKVLVKGEAGSFGVASTLKKAATLAGAGLVGLALGYKLHDPNRRWSLFHDDVENDKDSLTEDRATDMAGIVLGLKEHPAVERVVSAHYISDGLTALVRTKDGNAYEFQIRPAKYSRYHHDKTKPVTEEAGDEWEWSVKAVQVEDTTNLTTTVSDKKPLERPNSGKPVEAAEKSDLYPKGTIVTLGRSPIINPHFRGKEGKIIGVLDHLSPPMYIVATDFRLNPYHLYAEEFDVPQSQFYR